MSGEALEASRETDARVAELVMGKRVVWVRALYAYAVGEDGGLDRMVPEYVRIPCEDMGDGAVLYWTAGQDTPTEYAPEIIPRYSTDMAAAWPLAEKLSLWICPAENGHGWAAGRLANEDPDPERGAYADTAPLAICRAALACVDPAPIGAVPTPDATGEP